MEALCCAVGFARRLLANTPEAIADWLNWYDSLEPLIFTDAERAVWETARREQKEFELAAFDERAEKRREVWR